MKTEKHFPCTHQFKVTFKQVIVLLYFWCYIFKKYKAFPTLIYIYVSTSRNWNNEDPCGNMTLRVFHTIVSGNTLHHIASNNLSITHTKIMFEVSRTLIRHRQFIDNERRMVVLAFL